MKLKQTNKESPKCLICKNVYLQTYRKQILSGSWEFPEAKMVTCYKCYSCGRHYEDENQ